MQRSAFAPAFLAALAAALAACSPNETSAAEPGTLTTREEIQQAGVAAAAAEAQPQPSAVQPQPAAAAKEQAPAPCETPDGVTAASSAAPAAAPKAVAEESAVAPESADETALAKELALRPEDFDEWLAARPGEVVGARRDLVLGLAAGLRGDSKRAKALLTQVEGKSEVRAGEVAALRRLADPAAKTTVPAAAGKAESPLVLAATLGSVVRRAKEASRTGKSAEAAQRWTEALDLQLQAPWRLELAEMDLWAKQLADVQAQRRWNPLGEWPSHDLAVGAGDSLIAVRKRALQLDPQLLVCTGQIARANGLRNERIHPGQKLRVPKDRAKVVVDIEGHLVLYYLGEELAAFWPCGVGAQNSPTKAGVYTVGEKTRDPMWFRPGAAPVPYGDPANPLGTRWIEWMDDRGRSSGYGFHGTNEPQSIGGNGSQGCIRMRDADVEELFEILPKGAKIEVRR